MPIESFDEVKKYLEENKDKDEVKSLFTGFIPKDQLESYLDSEEGKKLLQPKLDKYFTKGLETWKANNLKKEVEAEISKRFPPETEEAKKLRELQEKLENMEKQATREKMKNNAIKMLNEKGLPVGLADYFHADTDEGMNEIINAIEGMWKNTLEAKVNERIKGKTPPAGNSNKEPSGMTKEKLLKMPMSERVKFFNENKEEFERLMNS